MTADTVDMVVVTSVACIGSLDNGLCCALVNVVSGVLQCEEMNSLNQKDKKNSKI